MRNLTKEEKIKIIKEASNDKLLIWFSNEAVKGSIFSETLSLIEDEILRRMKK